MPPLIVLNVAEKPSVARALAAVFAQCPGAVDQPMVRGEAAQIFVCDNVYFPNVLQQGFGRTVNFPDMAHTMITTSVRGHLATQDFGPQYGWSACQPVALFDAPIQTLYRPDMEPLEQLLQTQAKKVGALILWLDCDREGEAICAEVREVCLEGNNRLNGKIFRAKFSTVLPQEINRALRSLGRINEAFVQAVQARSEHDLRVGAAFTRFQTLRLQKKFDGFAGHSVISYGPCQFPTLGFVVERWARIETFVPEDFWFLEMAILVNSDGTVNGIVEETNGSEVIQNDGAVAPVVAQGRPLYLKWKRDRLYDRVLTMVLYESCIDAGEAVVINMTGRPKNKWRPVPLATVELQKRASRFLRIGSESLMSAAEELYQQGYISYPRTETEKFRSEFEHMPLIQSFQGIGGELGDYALKLLSNNNFQNPRAGQHDDNAHPPITPCKAVDPQTIPDPNHRAIYTLVVKHYLACCSRDALGKETTLTVKMASEEFKATGLMIIERNWLEIYAPWERWSTGQGELPRVEVGSRIVPSALLIKDGRTTAPQPISEVELISLMDRNGIGTDATIAQHITTIQERNYTIKDAQQKFLPTKLGIALVEGYNSMGYQLNKPDLRREMEAECNMVAAGQKTKDQIIGPILARMLECFNRANAEARKLDEAVARHFGRLGSDPINSRVLNGNFSICGQCNGTMSLKLESTGEQDRGNRVNDANTRAGRKLLFCANCATGFALPRGNPSPMKDPQNTEQPFFCPICQYQVIKIGPGEGYTGNGYHVCPKCFSDSPVEYGGSGGDFRCFDCSHPTCTLASGIRGGNVEVLSCPFCQASGSNGKVTLKKNSRGYILTCGNFTGTNGARDRCQYTIWLPKEVNEISVLTEPPIGTDNETEYCTRCFVGNKIVRRLKIVWKPGSVPPHYEREYIGCILCDDGLRSDMNINLPQFNQVRARNANNQTRGGRGTRNGRRPGRPTTDRTRTNHVVNVRNQGEISCFKCGQTGHYAGACPQNR